MPLGQISAHPLNIHEAQGQLDLSQRTLRRRHSAQDCLGGWEEEGISFRQPQNIGASVELVLLLRNSLSIQRRCGRSDARGGMKEPKDGRQVGPGKG